MVVMPWRDSEKRKAYQSQWYSDNREQHIAQCGANSQRRKAVNAAKVEEYKRTHPCVDCGEDDPIVLDFDHVCGTKFKAIAHMVRDGNGWTKILAEIDKCEVRCANCHRRVTASRRHSGIV